MGVRFLEIKKPTTSASGRLTRTESRSHYRGHLEKT